MFKIKIKKNFNDEVVIATVEEEEDNDDEELKTHNKCEEGKTI